MAEYTPSEARVCIDFCNAATQRKGPSGLLTPMTMEEADAAFTRWIESVRAAERERLAALAQHEHDYGLSDSHSESYRSGWRMGAAAERERIARNIEAARADGSAVGDATFNDGMDRAVRIVREGAGA